MRRAGRLSVRGLVVVSAAIALFCADLRGQATPSNVTCEACPGEDLPPFPGPDANPGQPQGVEPLPAGWPGAECNNGALSPPPQTGSPETLAYVNHKALMDSVSAVNERLPHTSLSYSLADCSPSLTGTLAGRSVEIGLSAGAHTKLKNGKKTIAFVASKDGGGYRIGFDAKKLRQMAFKEDYNKIDFDDLTEASAWADILCHELMHIINNEGDWGQCMGVLGTYSECQNDEHIAVTLVNINLLCEAYCAATEDLERDRLRKQINRQRELLKMYQTEPSETSDCPVCVVVPEFPGSDSGPCQCEQG